MENHVTPRGLQLLQGERERLEAGRTNVQSSDVVARRRELAELKGKLDLLNERIASARVVPAFDKPLKTVRFGATVTFRIVKGPQEGTERTFMLVGVDEASVAEGKISFIAPIAQALLGKRVGGVAKFRLGPSVQALKVLAIA